MPIGIRTKAFRKAIVGLLILFFFTFFGFVIHNNFGDSDVAKHEVQEAFDKGVGWIINNKKEIENEHNSVLWWMLGEAATLSNNHDLLSTVNDYANNTTQRYENSPWSYLILKKEPDLSQLNPSLLLQLPDYNLHFIYGFSCNRELAELDIIKEQNETGFCLKHHPISPACFTHQMMGFRFMQRSSCNRIKDIAEKLATLSGYVRFQSILDFRVADVYIQRVLMLRESNNSEKINQRWIRRILLHQRTDGGWGDFQPLIRIYENSYLGFTSRGISVASPKSTFHATAQGIWLMALLLNVSGAGP